MSQSQLIAAIPHSVALLYECRGLLRILKIDLMLNMPAVGIVTRTADLSAPHIEQFLSVEQSGKNMGRRDKATA